MNNDSPNTPLNRRPCCQWQAFLAVCVAATLGTAAAAAVENPAPSKEISPVPPKAVEDIEQKWGIQVSSVFLSAGGNMVDFRYRVLDPVKAAPLTKPENKPMLIDQTTGAKLLVPSTPKVGSLRQTTRQPVAGKVYFMLFANTQKHVKSGDKVTVTVGDFRAENLVVE